MKQILVGILVGLMLAFTGVAEAELGPELVVNGDFEDGSTGWLSWGTTPNIINVGLPYNNVVHSSTADDYAAQVVPVNVGDKYELQFDRYTVSVLPGHYKAGLIINRSDVVSASPGVFVEVLEPGLLEVYWDHPSLGTPLTGTNAWVRQTIVLQARGPASNIVVTTYPVYGGVTRVDNVSLRKVLQAPTASLSGGGIGVAGSTVNLSGIGTDADSGIISAVIKDSSGAVVAGGAVAKTGLVNVNATITVTPGMNETYTLTVTDEDGLTTVSATAQVIDIYADIIDAVYDVLNDLPPGLLKIARNNDGK